MPEPWQGHLTQAPILFLSSNPSIDPNIRDPNPHSSQSDEELMGYYDNSFDSPGGWIIDGKYMMGPNGRGRAQPFWAGVKCRAEELLQRNVKPGMDYAITEVVHCKSQGAEGVDESKETCARLWLRRVLEQSPARLIVVLGKKIPGVVKQELKIADNMTTQWGLWGPAEVVGRQRYVTFLGHPGGPDPKTSETCINDAVKLAALRAFLKDADSVHSGEGSD